MLTIGWHKDAIAQGYGMTLAQAATRITALETKTASMSAITDPNTNQPTVRFSGVNVQVVSGAGSTESPVNGTGNLIIGYNELRGSGNIRTGSHNFVSGLKNNYSHARGIVLGFNNTSSNVGAYVLGGENNTASGIEAVISGGSDNTASGPYSSVSGGASRSVTAAYDWRAGDLFQDQ